METYIVINATTKETKFQQGSFNFGYLQPLVRKGHVIMIVSLYSNSIKTPYIDEYGDFGWKDHNFKFEHINWADLKEYDNSHFGLEDNES